MSISANRNVKDSLFRYIFGQEENKHWLLELYNVLEGTNYNDVSQLKITTIENIIYMSMKNDVSFMIGSNMSLYEEQSTYNPNMPIRGFIYFGRLYDKFIEENDINIYSSKLIKLPKPKFIVFYMGTADKPDQVKLKLSDSFENASADEKEKFEWTAEMININAGHNKSLVQKCKPLYDYTSFVEKVRSNTEGGMKWNEAVDSAVDWAIENNMLNGFFKSHKAEVEDMCLTEFNRELYEKDLRQDGYEEGREAGRSEGIEQGALSAKMQTAAAFLKMGLSVEQVSQGTGLSVEEISQLAK